MKKKKSDADFFRNLFENVPRRRPVDDDSSPFAKWLESEEETDAPIDVEKEKMRKKFHKRMKRKD